MGASESSLTDGSSSNSSTKAAKFEDIPESCIALVLSYLDPPEIAKLARLNRAFRAASSADFIWVPKLPSTYPFILNKWHDPCFYEKGKMDIYARLCKATPFDGGTKEVWIDKRTGGVCLAVSNKAMRITGIDDRRYWNQISTYESRFQTVAFLQQIWWLEVEGDLEFQLPAGTYSLFFRLQLGKVGKRMGRRVCNSENVHGWDIKPVDLKLKTMDGQHVTTQCMLDNLGNWVNYHVGDFVVEDDSILTKIKFSLTQIDCTHTKGGLSVDSVFVCPSSLRKDVLCLDSEVSKKY